MAKTCPGRRHFRWHERELHGSVGGANLTGKLQGRIAGRTGVRRCQRPGRLLQEAGAAQQAGSKPSAPPALFHAKVTPKIWNKPCCPTKAGFVPTKVVLHLLLV